MKSFYFSGSFLLAFFVAGSCLAQVKLPIDAGNCAIFNALNPDNTLYCRHAIDLGAPRGLIVRMDAGQVVAQLPNPDGNTAILKRPVSSRPGSARIDHKAAKSESGYYIHFAFNSDTLEKAYRDHLDRLAVVLNSASMKTNCVKITGHTDTVGTARYNFDLSRRRAKSVYDYLTAIDQIDKTRFTIEAAGESRPLPDKTGTSPYNRRVEFSSKSSPIACRPKS